MRDGFFVFESERSSKFSVGELLNGKWYLVNEKGAFTLEEINRRGWTVRKRVDTSL